MYRKGAHFEKEMTLWGVRWYVAYPMSYRQLEEMRGERLWCKILQIAFLSVARY